MGKMNQKGTDFGTRAETGEREPKGAKASDSSGERRDKVPRADSEKGTRGETGEREPKGVKSRDASGERKEGMAGGVGMGKADGLKGRDSGHMGKHDGRTGEMNDGNKGERTVYNHKKEGY